MRKLACGCSQLRELHPDVRSEKLNLPGVTEYKPVAGRKEQKEKGVVSPDSRQQVGTTSAQTTPKENSEGAAGAGAAASVQHMWSGNDGRFARAAHCWGLLLRRSKKKEYGHGGGGAADQDTAVIGSHENLTSHGWVSMAGGIDQIGCQWTQRTIAFKL